MNGNNSDKTAHRRWIAYRPEIRILDCTIRDGGLINDHKFDDDFVSRIYRTGVEAGIDYVEMGYKASRRIYAPDRFGKWKFCLEDDLRRVIGEKDPAVRVTVMADAERTDYREDILPREKSVVDCVRVAAYIHQIPTAVDMIRDAHDKGYETMFQLMAVSAIQEHDLLEGLEIIAETPADTLYLVDSFGSLYSEQVRHLVGLYRSAMDGTGKEIGFHGHNNQQLAFANTIEAIIAGANRFDATYFGIGRGAGNCPMELLVSFLHNPKFKIRPVLKCCEEVFAPLSKKMDWGYSIPYAITAHFNRHPSAAIKLRAGDNPDAYVTFYDQMIQEES